MMMKIFKFLYSNKEIKMHPLLNIWMVTAGYFTALNAWKICPVSVKFPVSGNKTFHIHHWMYMTPISMYLGYYYSDKELAQMIIAFLNGYSLTNFCSDDWWRMIY